MTDSVEEFIELQGSRLECLGIVEGSSALHESLDTLDMSYLTEEISSRSDTRL